MHQKPLMVINRSSPRRLRHAEGSDQYGGVGPVVDPDDTADEILDLISARDV